MARRKRQQLRMSYKLLVIILIVALVLCIAIGTIYFVSPSLFKKIFNFNDTNNTVLTDTTTATNTVTLQEGDVSVHFLELGNDNAGDCTLIKTGNVEVLIDAGSKSNSIDTISSYIDTYCTDGILEYVIVTHAHQDHIACFAGTGGATYRTIFDRYECRMIIDFPLTNSTTALYNRYLEERDAEIANGAIHYTALQCYNQTDGAKREYTLADGVTLEILYNYYYEHTTSNENNYSVCCLLKDGDYKYLLTGDLEGNGEDYLIQYNTLSKVNVYKAGHHGSYTASSSALIDIIQPDIVIFTAVMGMQEYTSNIDNVFPSLEAIKNITKYTQNMYCNRIVNETTGESELYNGNIVIISNSNITVACSNLTDNITVSNWYKTNRASKLSA